MARNTVAFPPLNPQPVLEFTIPQRAGLQLLGDALQYLAGDQPGSRDAALIIWAAREAVLRAAERKRIRTAPGRLYVAWRNPKAGAR